MIHIKMVILRNFQENRLCGFKEEKMSFSIDEWMEKYISAVQNQFHDRIWFLGLHEQHIIFDIWNCAKRCRRR